MKKWTVDMSGPCLEGGGGGSGCRAQKSKGRQIRLFFVQQQKKTLSGGQDKIALHA